MTYESYKSCVAPEGIYNGTQIREGDVITLQRGGTGFAAHDGKAVQAKRFFHMGPGSGKARTHPPACMQPAACFRACKALLVISLYRLTRQWLLQPLPLRISHRYGCACMGTGALQDQDVGQVV